MAHLMRLLVVLFIVMGCGLEVKGDLLYLQTYDLLDFSREIKRYDPNSGALDTVLTAASNQNLNNIAVASDGTIYGATFNDGGFSIGAVYKFTGESTQETLLTGSGVKGMTLGLDGMLYLQTYDLLDFSREIKRYDSSSGLFDSVLTAASNQTLNNIAVAADGTIYGATFNDGGFSIGAVYKFTGESTQETLLTGSGVKGMTLGLDGMLYLQTYDLLDFSREIKRYDPNSGALDTVLTAASNQNLNNIAVAADGTIYGATFNDGGFSIGAVYKFTGESTQETLLTGSGVKGMTLAAPAQVEVGVQEVYLAWDDMVPYVLSQKVTAWGDEIVVPTSGPESLNASTELAFRESVEAMALGFFSDAGIDNIVFTDSPSEDAIKVYFTVATATDDLGMSVSGVDRFNAADGADVILFANALETEQKAAATLAHEVGHTLGLMHVNDSLTNIMNPIYSGQESSFLNVVTPIVGESGALLGGALTHDPEYHLRHYLGDEGAADLGALGIQPGTWDESGLFESELDSLLRIIGSGVGADMVLYDVFLLSGYDTDTMGVVHMSDEMTLGDLLDVSLEIDPGMGLRLMAASTPGGDLDIALSLGDPGVDENVMIRPGVGVEDLYLQRYLGGGGFATLAEMSLETLPLLKITADFNFDGAVNIADLIAWAQGFGTTNAYYQDGDANRNGLVNIEDLIVWAQNFGSTTPVGPEALGGAAVVSATAFATAIPEPTGLIVMGVGGMGLLRRRRREGVVG